MVKRLELEKYIEGELIKIISNIEIYKELCVYNKEIYNIPRAITSDYISMRLSLSQASEFILFCLLDAIEKITEKHKTEVDKYFSMQEVKIFRNSKYEIDDIKFPLRFKVIKIAEDQWIGKIDIAMMMKLRAAQLINYNVNAQRTMQRIIKGDKKYYKITLNQTAINEMEKLFKNGTYIPTPFTLNIPQDEDSDFIYDEEKCELVINSLKYFDITDGYHRYATSCKINDEDKDFNYVMELRIINFSDDKARQFIYQEDQKTKMRKIDSDSLNINKSSNIVVSRLNESPRCNLQGLISRNEGIINFADLSNLVQYFYFKNTKINEKTIIINAVKELIDNFNLLTEYNLKYLENEYSFKQLVAVMCTFNYFNDKDKKNMCEVIDKVVEETEKLENKKFYSRYPKKTMMNDIESIIKEVV